ncbi:hypothetical protein [Aeromonas salmonicida]|uniref:hypothetical protein n=1 Tax=Aeromonas salmonicida TaxID=645 RepID=UPI00259F7D81|nr:hypothetical protein [Aeromonas salmonicida]MDM5100319.1 hypothetical protein [Aeromonas salmonicida]
MDIELLSEGGQVVNTIIADEAFADTHFPGRWRVRLLPDPQCDLANAIEAALINIKYEAERRITALDWRLQRAQEREQLGEAGFETVANVLALREQIRQASNAAEQAVSTLTEVGAVQAFTW